jgi:manganese-dependent ADP-ribose/CDP-alcohol diphosphatase
MTMAPERIESKIGPCARLASSSSACTADEDDNDAAATAADVFVVNTTSTDPSYLFSMGLLADIQYAPVEDGFSFSGSPRYYRHALEASKYAAQYFQDVAAVDVVVNLGDTVDGKAKEAAAAVVVVSEEGQDEVQQEQALDQVLREVFAAYRNGPVLHTYGNHCLYNHNRIDLQRKLNIPFVREPCGDLVGYYSYLAPAGHHSSLGDSISSSSALVRFVVLDSYDISLLQRCPEKSQKRAEAVQILRENNGDNYRARMENSPEGLLGVQRRYVAFNGAVGPLQLQWLRNQLDEARNNCEIVLLFSHQPIHPQSSHPVCLIWNYSDVLDVLYEYRDVVAASFAGHAHKGGYCREHGIHFRVIEAVLESPPPIRTFAVVDVHQTKLVVQGHGDCDSAEYALDHLSINNR